MDEIEKLWKNLAFSRTQENLSLTQQVSNLIEFKLNLVKLLFGDDYTEHVSPEMLTDEKLLEAVRMLKEVY